MKFLVPTYKPPLYMYISVKLFQYNKPVLLNANGTDQVSFY